MDNNLCERCKEQLDAANARILELCAKLSKAHTRILELQSERSRLDDLLVKAYQ